MTNDFSNVGPDFWSTGMFGAVATAASVLFFVTQIAPGMQHPWLAAFGAFIMYGLSLGCWLLASTSDPGVIPAQPSNKEVEGIHMKNGIPQTRTIVVNGSTVPIKYCRTCRIWRPPRASHCRDCNACVAKFDHHCPWVGKCIGAGNYRFFFWYLTFLNGTILYTMIATIIRLQRVCDQHECNRAPHLAVFMAVASEELGPGAMLSECGFVAFLGFMLLLVGPLYLYHCTYLAPSNISTNEDIKQVYSEGNPNPHSMGCSNNCHASVCANPSAQDGYSQLIETPGDLTVASAALDIEDLEV